MELKLDHVFELSTEAEGDYIFTPSGIVIVLENTRFQVFCQSSNHNLFRAALQRNSWEDLGKGVLYRGITFRVSEITEKMAQRGWTDTGSIPFILHHCFEMNRRHLFFLQRYLEA